MVNPLPERSGRAIDALMRLQPVHREVVQERLKTALSGGTTLAIATGELLSFSPTPEAQRHLESDLRNLGITKIHAQGHDAFYISPDFVGKIRLDNQHDPTSLYVGRGANSLALDAFISVLEKYLSRSFNKQLLPQLHLRDIAIDYLTNIALENQAVALRRMSTVAERKRARWITSGKSDRRTDLPVHLITSEHAPVETDTPTKADLQNASHEVAEVESPDDLLTELSNANLSEGPIDLLQLLFNDLRSVPRLAPGQDLMLGKKIAEGNPKEADDAKKQLLATTIALVVSLALQRVRSGESKLSVLDNIQNGMLGAAEAANIFDYRMGHQFTTLAWWYIKKAMSREEQNTRNTVRLSVYVIDILSEVNHARKVLGHDADLEEIVKLVNARRQERYQAKLREGKTPEPPTEVHTDIIRSAKAALNIDSLERPVGEEGTETLGDFVEDNDMDTEEKTILTARRHAARQAVSIENASQTKNVEELTARQIEILNLRFGLEDGIEHTLEEVAQILYDRDRAAGKPVEKPSSRQAIDKAEKAALAKLRKKLQEWAN